MKRRMRRLGGLAMAAVLTAGLALNVNAVTLNDAQQKADELEEQKGIAGGKAGFHYQKYGGHEVKAG